MVPPGSGSHRTILTAFATVIRMIDVDGGKQREFFEKPQQAGARPFRLQTARNS